MANIIQAAQWMTEGKRVRRSIWATFIPPMYADEFGELSFERVVDKPAIEVAELLADDWEIAE